MDQVIFNPKLPELWLCEKMSMLLEMYSKVFRFERTCFIKFIFKWLEINAYECVHACMHVYLYPCLHKGRIVMIKSK